MTYELELTRDFGKKILDQDAYTIPELSESCGLGLAQTGKKARALVDTGQWEQVYKLAPSGRIVTAFRPKR